MCLEHREQHLAFGKHSVSTARGTVITIMVVMFCYGRGKLQKFSRGICQITRCHVGQGISQKEITVLSGRGGWTRGNQKW